MDDSAPKLIADTFSSAISYGCVQSGPPIRTRARHELLAICKAMTEEGTGPDFIVVDGSEGATGAAGVRGSRRYTACSASAGHRRPEPGELLDTPPESWAAAWCRADPDSFKARRTREDTRHADRR